MDDLMRDEDLLREAKRWADMVRRQAKSNAAGFSKGKSSPHTYIKGRYAGKTEFKLKDRLGYVLRKRDGDLESVSFKMPVHGIFREYGVGNGQPSSGVTSQKVYLKRSMSDWFHGPVDKNFDQFADVVGEYYGDKVLVEFKRLNVN